MTRKERQENTRQFVESESERHYTSFINFVDIFLNDGQPAKVAIGMAIRTIVVRIGDTYTPQEADIRKRVAAKVKERISAFLHTVYKKVEDTANESNCGNAS